MLTFTDTAAARVRSFLAKQEGQGVSALRIAGTRKEHKLWLVKPADRQDGDRVMDGGGFDVTTERLATAVRAHLHYAGLGGGKADVEVEQTDDAVHNEVDT